MPDVWNWANNKRRDYGWYIQGLSFGLLDQKPEENRFKRGDKAGDFGLGIMAALHLFGKYKHQAILVDAEDFAYLRQFNWFNRNGYAYRWVKGKIIAMHRVIMKAKENQYLDHINGNKLDNRKSNLRFATYQQNLCNRPKQSNNTSGFKGVSWHNQDKKWRVRISVMGKVKHLGLFDNIRVASKVYQEAARYYHKEYAWRGG